MLTMTFLIIEVVAGLITQSLALLSDAAHMFTDAAALAIALAAIKIAKRPADDKRTFGYQRFEILAALFNASMLFFVAMYILYEAYQRFTQPPEIQSIGMLVVASIGLIINLISMKILMSSATESLNMKGAYLEVLSDALGSVGVIIGAVIIYYTNWYWVDTIIAVAIGFWVLPRTWILLKQSINILLEGVPEEGHIRQYLIEDKNYLDAVIGLPANIFYGTSIPTCILVFKKCREDTNNVLFIDASNHFEKAKNQNNLREEDIEKIVSTYKSRTAEDKYSYLATLEEIKENDYNLNIPRYVDTFEEEDVIDLDRVSDDLKALENDMKTTNETIASFCRELNISTPF
jgi:cation diffusion facilitator family transporter